MDDLWFPCRQLLPSNERTQRGSASSLLRPACMCPPSRAAQSGPTPSSERRASAAPCSSRHCTPPLRRASVQPGHLAIMPTLGLAYRAHRHPWPASAPCGSAALPSGAAGCFLAIVESELVNNIATLCPNSDIVLDGAQESTQGLLESMPGQRFR
jgi:hypothetical protein